LSECTALTASDKTKQANKNPNRKAKATQKQKALHLLHRTTFGLTLQQMQCIERQDKEGIKQWLDMQFNPDLKAFSNFTSCGIPNVEMTSILHQKKPTTIDQSFDVFIQKFQNAF